MTVQMSSGVLWLVITVTLGVIAPGHATGFQALTMLCAAYRQKKDRSLSPAASFLNILQFKLDCTRSQSKYTLVISGVWGFFPNCNDSVLQ